MLLYGDIDKLTSLMFHGQVGVPGRYLDNSNLRHRCLFLVRVLKIRAFIDLEMRTLLAQTFVSKMDLNKLSWNLLSLKTKNTKHMVCFSCNSVT